MNPCRALSSYTFGSSGLPIPKSGLEYSIKVVAMAFSVSSSTKFEISASVMCLVVDTKYASRLCDCKLKIEFYLSPTTYLQVFKELMSKTEHLQQPVRQTYIQRWSREHKIRGQGHKKKSEAKAKDSLSEGRHSRGQGQERSRPRTKDTSVSALQNKRSSQKFFRKSQKKKRSSQKFFQAISTKKRFPKNFSSAPQNFNNSKNSAVLEPRTGQFSRT